MNILLSVYDMHSLCVSDECYVYMLVCLYPYAYVCRCTYMCVCRSQRSKSSIFLSHTLSLLLRQGPTLNSELMDSIGLLGQRTPSIFLFLICTDPSWGYRCVSSFYVGSNKPNLNVHSCSNFPASIMTYLHVNLN